MKKLLMVTIITVLIAGIILSGCSTANNQSVKSSNEKVLKIGYVYNSENSAGLDGEHAVSALIEQDNKNGGWNIGGEKYKIQLIQYDNQSSQSGEVNAVNRLVFKDKVKFIIHMADYLEAVLPIADANNVMMFHQAMNAVVALDPKYKYSYSSAGMQIGNAAFVGWMAKHFENAKSKSIVGAFPDNKFGHILASDTMNVFKAFKLPAEAIYFPASSEDLSSLATKVKTINPGFFTAVAGSDVRDALVYNSVRMAGYKGQFFSLSSTTADTLAKGMSQDALNGFISRANAYEFDPPMTQIAKDVKDIWTAKYGKWDNPALSHVYGYYVVKAALEQAGSLDVTKVAAVMDNGMKYDTPDGPAEMVSRSDIGNKKTVDSAFTQYIRQVVNGKPVLLEKISTADAVASFRNAFPPLPPGASPPKPMGAPPGPPPQ